MHKKINLFPANFLLLVLIVLSIVLSSCNPESVLPQETHVSTPQMVISSTPDPQPTPSSIFFENENEPVIQKVTDLPGGNYLVLLQAKWVNDSTLTQVVFQEYRENANGELYLKNPIVALKMVEGIAYFSAALNSDGTKFVIVPHAYTGFIAIVNLLDASVQRIEIKRKNCADPSWSPAEDQILLNCDSDDGYPELFLLTLEDQRFEQITDCASSGTACGMGNWSPDGSWITFQKAGFGSGVSATGLYTIPAACLQDPQMCPQNELYISKDLSGYLAWLEDGKSAIILGNSGFQRCEMLPNGDFSCVNEPVPGAEDFSDTQGLFQIVNGEYLYFLNSDDQMMSYSLVTKELKGLIRNADNSSILGKFIIP